jgi:hypothetical protein
MDREAWLPVAGLLLLAACTGSERQRPIGLSDVYTGEGSMEATRRQLQGTWELLSLESSPSPGTPRVAIKASGSLVYDEYGNLRIDAHTVDPAAPAAARESAVLNFKGRAAIDPVKKELQLLDMTGNADPTEVLAPERKRRFEIDGDTLKLSSIDEKGEPVAVSLWRRRK